jgi:predicted nucleic acid-binding Zn ribbon protein
MAHQNSRKCLSCGTPLVGRIDKRFCSDQCRYIENNKRKHNTEAIVLDAYRATRKNWMILKTLCPHGKSVVRKTVLDAMGFRSDLFTTLYLTSKKQLYYFCYDFGFTPVFERNIQKVVIVARQTYMGVWDPWKYASTRTQHNAKS